MRPPVAYYGGKTSIARQIVALLPEHGHYVEPFGGSLAVLLAKPPSRMETVNDIDQDLMTFWRVLRDRPADLERVCLLTPHSRGEHQLAFQPADDELEQARRVWVRLTQGRAGTLRRTGRCHYQDPGRSYVSMPGYLRGYCGRIATAAERLARVPLESRPALEVIADYGRHRGVLLYADPPYLAVTRTSVNYRHEMPGDADHRELAAALHTARAAVVLVRLRQQPITGSCIAGGIAPRSPPPPDRRTCGSGPRCCGPTARPAPHWACSRTSRGSRTAETASAWSRRRRGSTTRRAPPGEGVLAEPPQRYLHPHVASHP